MWRSVYSLPETLCHAQAGRACCMAPVLQAAVPPPPMNFSLQRPWISAIILIRLVWENRRDHCRPRLWHPSMVVHHMLAPVCCSGIQEAASCT